jgi:Transposase DDE domain
MCGVQTNIVTAVEVTEDSPRFQPLVEATAQNFKMREVSADKAYLSNPNMSAVIRHRAFPFIAFKANSKADKRKSYIWNHMYHYYSYNQEKFMQSYHKRSSVETTFMMIKAKFGDSLRSKTEQDGASADQRSLVQGSLSQHLLRYSEHVRTRIEAEVLERGGMMIVGQAIELSGNGLLSGKTHAHDKDWANASGSTSLSNPEKF